MAQFEKLVALLTEFGVGFEIEDASGKMSEEWRSRHPAVDRFIVCTEGADKIEGYCGFFAQFAFDANGQFIVLDVLE